MFIVIEKLRPWLVFIESDIDAGDKKPYWLCRFRKGGVLIDAIHYGTMSEAVCKAAIEVAAHE